MGVCSSTELGPAVLSRAPLPDDPDFYVTYNGQGVWYSCTPDGVVAPRLAKKGMAGPSVEPTTLIDALEKAAKLKPDAPALRVERPLPAVKDGVVPPALELDAWTMWTYKSYLQDVRRLGRSLIATGLKQFESVCIWGFNAPEWHISALAAMHAGGKVAGIYPTDTGETAAYKVVHSGCGVVVVEDEGKLKKLVKALSDRKDCRRLKAFVAYGFVPAAGRTEQIAGLGAVPVLSWEAMMESGQKIGEQELDQRKSLVTPGHCAALIYTSGTTGEPKAVMISHDNIFFEGHTIVRVLRESVGFAARPENEERVLSYLPLSHIAGFAVDVVAPILATACSPGSMQVFFARSYDLKEKTIKDRLCVARPTVFLGVPLVWEKIADQMRAVGASITGVQKMVADAAKGLALQKAQGTQIGGDNTTPFFYSMAQKVVLSKIKARLGLDELKYGLTGAAPIRLDTLEYFASLGIDINEVYGMSECCGAATISTPQAHQWGSCGWEIPGVEVKAFIVDPANLNKKSECPKAPALDDAEEKYQGELCYRGRNIMMGYMACPDLGAEHVAEITKKTADAIDAEGWLHSGDKGMITEQGMVKITGRYKELIIGEGGENIAPVPIEDRVKKQCDGINEVMMIGDKRKYNVAIVTLKAVGANGEVPGTDDLDAGAKRVNQAITKISQAMDDKTWIDAVTAAFTAANNDGKCCPNNSFKIQKFTILPSNFSEEKGELTPTKKLKRKVVEDAYKALIERMYASTGSGYIRYE